MSGFTFMSRTVAAPLKGALSPGTLRPASNLTAPVSCQSMTTGPDLTILLRPVRTPWVRLTSPLSSLPHSPHNGASRGSSAASRVPFFTSTLDWII